ncbi:MAG: UDP-N-acetylglucosamine 1-carboxyvinyltransferase [Clostridia bacterium]|nr:UDP-N-acetylglucosamine 1-carboxyvinyltransferase [Clostridia bacterium]MBQ1965177.1 UDP-N-acetylglucosamine 1-carboxyvinyltransferase [Clostridia bacterium]
MEKFVIHGGHPLEGVITVSGSKNSAVGIIPATVLVKGACILDNVPEISDVFLLFEILRSFGAEVTRLEKSTYRIDCSAITEPVIADQDAVRKMRASYYLIGALLGRFGQATVGLPGGCDFGSRPIDQHIKGFESLGAKVVVDPESCNVIAESDGLNPASIYFDIVSVGATVNVMLAAVGVSGKVTIENAAKEPHVVDIANFLNAMGADIKGAGTNVIRINGGKELKGGRYEIVPDQIEAGTYMVAAAIAGGRVEVKNVIPKHMESISAKLEEAGVGIEELDDSIIVTRLGRPEPINLKTQPYPGFPTDMQPQFSTMLTMAQGTSVIREGVYEQRFRYAAELRKMGANIEVDGNVCVINGVEKLSGATVRACDLRAGVSMVLAGLAAEGTTEVYDIRHIERGYEGLVEKLRSLGARIEKVDDGIDGEELPERLS